MAASRSEALAPRRATYQDVLDAPAHLVAEIIDGTLHTHPRPAVPHTRASSVLGRKIGTPYDDDTTGPDGWWILDEPELHLGHEILVPDLAGWRRERMPELLPVRRDPRPALLHRDHRRRSRRRLAPGAIGRAARSPRRLLAMEDLLAQQRLT